MKLVFHQPPPKRTAPPPDVRRRASSVPPGHSAEEYPENLAKWRRENLPVISPEEDEWKARQQKRPRRIVRHSCGRSVFVGRVCFECQSLGYDRSPAPEPTAAERRRDWRNYQQALASIAPQEMPPLTAMYVGRTPTRQAAHAREHQALRRQRESLAPQVPPVEGERGRRRR